MVGEVQQMDGIDGFLVALDGSLVTSCSYLGVQYLGERRVFKVVGIREYVDKSEAENRVGELQHNFSQLDLSESEVFQRGSCSSSEEFHIYKITGRSKLKILAEPLKGGGSGGIDGESSGHRPLSFLEVGGLKKQIRLLKELLLHPLKALTDKGNLNCRRCLLPTTFSRCPVPLWNYPVWTVRSGEVPSGASPGLRSNSRPLHSALRCSAVDSGFRKRVSESFLRR